MEENNVIHENTTYSETIREVRLVTNTDTPIHDESIRSCRNETIHMIPKKVLNCFKGDVSTHNLAELKRKRSELCRRSNLRTKFKANMWKCYQIRKKHYIQTTCILFLPIISFAFLGYGRAVIGEKHEITFNEPTYNPFWYEDDIYNTFKLDIESSVIMYTPETNFTNDLMRRVQLKLDLLNHGIKSFPSEEHLLRHYFTDPSKISFAVIFHELKNNSIPTHLDYDIRFNDNNIRWQTNTLFLPDEKYIQGSGSEDYFASRFILLQMAIDTNYIQMQKQFNLTLGMQEFPYPPYKQSEDVMSVLDSLPFVTVLSFILLCPTMLKNIVEEKDSGVKELMKMMGLPTIVMWICWFIEIMILNTISIIVMVACMKIYFGANVAVLEYCNPILLGVFLFLYCSSSMAYCFFISSIINSPNFTTVIGLIIWMFSFFLAVSFREILKNLPLQLQLLSCIFPNFSMQYGYDIISFYEKRDIGLQWRNISEPAPEGINELTMMHIYAMFLVDIFIFICLATYIDSINPGKMGVGKPWYYPFNIRNSFTRTKKKISTSENIYYRSSSKIEECNSNPAIRIQNLNKVYEKPVLQDFSINFYEGEITALLGHNGAGKTTILSIISGMVSPTSGTVEIAGHDLVDELDYIRSIVGVCPQENLLFTDLTVEQHLIFIASLNGLENFQEKVKKLLLTLDLYNERDKLPSMISGGMKRKLCLGMAVIKEPKILILDEPTSGLDTVSRHGIWDILNNIRKDDQFKTCSVIISTHYMEEAEHLGEKIAIIDHGICMALGSPQFLKRKYGTGTNLTIVIDNPSDEIYARIDKVFKNSVYNHIEKTKKLNSITYRINQDSNSLLNIVRMLEDLKKEKLVNDIQITNTSLDDVLACISKPVVHYKPPSIMDTDNQEGLQPAADTAIDVWFSGSVSTKASSITPPNCGTMILILFRIHLQFIWNMKWTYIIPALFCLIVTLALLLLSVPYDMNHMMDNNGIQLNLDLYGKTNVFCSSTNSSNTTDFLKEFKKHTTSNLGHIMEVSSVSKALINEGIKNFDRYNKKAVVAAEFNYSGHEVIINAMYSNSALHGAPISWNWIANVIAATYLGTDVSITTRNNPLPVANMAKMAKLSELRIAVLWILFFPFGLLVFMEIFTRYPHVQRRSNLLQLLNMAGVKKNYYWLELFILDYAMYAFLSLLILGLIRFVPNAIFSGSNQIGIFATVLFTYGLLTIPIMYLLSFFETTAEVVCYLQMYNLMFGVLLTAISQSLISSGLITYMAVGHKLRNIFIVFPQFSIMDFMNTICRKAVWKYNWSILDDNAKKIQCMVSHNPCCEGNTTSACQSFNSSSSIMYDVRVQFLTTLCIIAFILCIKGILLFRESRIHSFTKTNFFEVVNLKKKFKNKAAIQDLNLNIEEGTCLGLLGVNGSGKTTTFKLLTNALKLDGGDASIDSDSLRKQKKEYLSKIGYCPQVDALHDVITVREMLRLFGNIRGHDNVNDAVDILIDELGLTEYSNKLCGDLSGGTKRKLSLGISLIVDPKVIMLDEPTCGVDPISRRHLWTFLANKKIQSNKTMVLTSHSLSECEFLCDSVSILDKGRVITQKTPVSVLKKRYAKIYTVEIKVNKNSNDIILKVQKSFIEFFKSQEAHLQSKHLHLLKFKVNRTATLGQVLEKMESFRKNCPYVEDYVISMPNLEEIFLNIIDQKDNSSRVDSAIR